MPNLLCPLLPVETPLGWIVRGRRRRWRRRRRHRLLLLRHVLHQEAEEAEATANTAAVAIDLLRLTSQDTNGGPQVGRLDLYQFDRAEYTAVVGVGTVGRLVEGGRPKMRSDRGGERGGWRGKSSVLVLGGARMISRRAEV